MLADQAERALKDQQTLLDHKESELRSMEEHVRLLEEQVASLKRVSETDRDELSKLRATVAALDREKDELQVAVDEKTEQEASRLDAVATRVSEIFDVFFYFLPVITFVTLFESIILSVSFVTFLHFSLFIIKLSGYSFNISAFFRFNVNQSIFLMVYILFSSEIFALPVSVKSTIRTTTCSQNFTLLAAFN